MRSRAAFGQRLAGRTTRHGVRAEAVAERTGPGLQRDLAAQLVASAPSREWDVG